MPWLLMVLVKPGRTSSLVDSQVVNWVYGPILGFLLTDPQL